MTAPRDERHAPSTADWEAIERAHQATAVSLEQVVDLLTGLVDLGRPGAMERGRRLAGAAVQLAERFEIPAGFLRNLALAARLHEIGMLVDRPTRAGLAGSASDDWRYTVVSKAVLGQIEQLRDVADLVESIRENWDGSGYPGRLQRGQIPFRSRILHVLIDFYAQLDGAASGGRPIPGEAAARALEEHAGTWYDPVIVTQLGAMIGGLSDLDSLPSRLVLPVNELDVGMVLAEDLCTSSGVKLLARGSALTRSTLGIILQRHQSDPIIAGAWVERSAPG
jgi:response regulator RpfG family c-di-GMP phosphodiesterase